MQRKPPLLPGAFLLTLILLAACQTNPAASRTQTAASTPASSHQQRLFENAIARKILKDVQKDLLATPFEARAAFLAAKVRQFDDAVDASHLTSAIRVEAELLRYLSTHAYLAPAGNQYRDFQYLVRSLTSLNHSLEQHEQQLRAELVRIDQTIAVLTTRQPDRFNVASHMETVRTSARYPEDTVRGRQAWLDTLSQAMIDAQLDWPSVLQNYPPSALQLSGVENAARTLTYRRGQLTVDLTRVEDLPRFETRALAVYYGYPGLQSMAEAPEGLRTFVHLPAYTFGWAAYITDYIATRDVQHTASYLYFLKTIAALGMADLRLNTGEWEPADALEYLVRETPYARHRLQLMLGNVQDNPGVHLAGILGKLEFSRMHHRCMVTQGQCDAAFHQQIVNLGVVPFSILRSRL